MNQELLNGFLALGGLVLFYIKYIHRTTIQKRKPNIHAKGYHVIYTDQKGDVDPSKVIVSELLKSQTYDLRGKPDYILMNKNKTDMLVIELKSGKIGGRPEPHYGDLMQLAAYFLMIEDVFKIRPKKGRLVYKDFMFVVYNTGNLRKDLLKILSEMRDMLTTQEGKANASFVTCRHCVCKGTVCTHCKE